MTLAGVLETLVSVEGTEVASAKLTAFGRIIDRVSGASGQSLTKMQAVGKVAILGLGAAAAVGIGKAVSTFQTAASETRKLTRELGLIPEEASRLRFAGNAVGLTVDQMSRGFGFLSKNLVNGGKAVTQYGISLTDANGQQKPFSVLLGEVADKFNTLPPGVERSAFAMNIFGKSGKDLIPLLARGSAGIAALEAQADKLGVTMSGKDVEAARQLGLASHELHASIQGVEISLARAFVPELTSVANAMTTFFEIVNKIPGPLKSFLALGAVGAAALTGLGLVVRTVRTGLGELGIGLVQKTVAEEGSIAADAEQVISARSVTTAWEVQGATARELSVQGLLANKAVGLGNSALGAMTGSLGALAIAGVAGAMAIKAVNDWGSKLAQHHVDDQVNNWAKSFHSGATSADDLVSSLSSIEQKTAHGGGIMSFVHAITPLSSGIEAAKVSSGDFAGILNRDLIPAMAQGRLSQDKWNEAVRLSNTFHFDAIKLLREYQQRVEGASYAQFQAGITAQTMADSIKTTSERIDDNRGILQRFADETGQSFGDLKDQILDAMSKVGTGSRTELLDKVKASYKELLSSTADTFNGVKSALLGFAGQGKTTAKEIIKSLDDQLAAMDSYGKDWAVVVARAKGKAGAQGLLAALNDMGLEGSNVVHALARSNSDQFNKILGDWKKGEKGSKSLSQQIVTSLVGAFEKVINAVREALDLPPIDFHVKADTSDARASVTNFLADMKKAGLAIGVSGSITGDFALSGGGQQEGQQEGGPILGYGGGDVVPAWLEPGEFVMRKEAVRMWGTEWLASLNKAPGFSAGGVIGPGSVTGVSGLVDTARGIDFLAPNLAKFFGVARVKPWILDVPSFPAATGPIAAMVNQLASTIYGWVGAQIGALDWVISHESGFNPNAQNPTSTAYGLFQFLDSTWASVGGHKTSDPYLQTIYGLRYIAQRYGTPVGAQAFWEAHHWYGDGLDTIVDRPTIIGVGEKGPERVTVQPLGGSLNDDTMDRLGQAIGRHVKGGDGGDTYNIYEAASPEQILGKIAFARATRPW